MRKLLKLPGVLKDMNRLAGEAMSPRVLTAFIDFDYQHYALGDMLTKEVHCACRAIDAGCEAIDLMLIVDPSRPSAPAQGFVTPENYVTHLCGLAPAFLCTPMLRALHILRDHGLSASYYRVAAAKTGHPHWPSYRAQTRREITYPLGHHEINDFHARRGHVPKLHAPRGYEDWVRAFAARHMPGKFVVCVNPRQSRLTASPAVTYRDANLEDWYAFIDRAGAALPEVVFVQLGGYAEWDRTILHRDNVVVPRAMGLGLAHELALMSHARMFIGTSSGFATMATFSDLPYLICDVEHFFAPFAGIEVGAHGYPFAREDQFLLWEKEEPDLLFAHLERVFERWPGPDDAASVASEAHPAAVH